MTKMFHETLKRRIYLTIRQSAYKTGPNFAFPLPASSRLLRDGYNRCYDIFHMDAKINLGQHSYCTKKNLITVTSKLQENIPEYLRPQRRYLRLLKALKFTDEI